MILWHTFGEDPPDLPPAFGEAFELKRWPGDTDSADDGPLLLRLADASPERLDSLPAGARLLLVVVDADLPAEERFVDRFAALGQLPPDKPWTLVDLRWPPELVVAHVRTAATAWQQRAEEAAAETAQVEDLSVELMVRGRELERLRAIERSLETLIGEPGEGKMAEIVRNRRTLAELLDELQHDTPPVVLDAGEALVQSAQDVERLFRSLYHWQRIERALHGRVALLVSASRKARNLFERAFSRVGCRVDAAATAAEGAALLRKAAPDLLFVDWENVKFLGDAHAAHPQLPIVLLTSQLLFEQRGLEMLGLPLANVLIMSDAGLGSTDDALLLRELTVTSGKLLTNDVFGLEKYLAWGSEIHEAFVTSSHQRYEVLERVSAFGPQCGLRRSLHEHLETLTDELLMNAIWDAPQDETGHPKYAGLSRGDELKLMPHEYPVVRWGADDRLLGVSVTDPFGALDREHAFNYLVKCFARGADQIDKKFGGAGLGLYSAFLSVSTFIINVAPNLRTEVIGLLDLKLTRRALSGRSRSYHYFRSQLAA